MINHITKDDIEACRNFLRKIELINLNTPKSLDSDFNIFSILRKEYEEVGLHSRFIFELLNPEGGHHRNTLFLESFLKTIHNNGESVDINFNINNAKVKREAGYIDILITNDVKEAIIIENKIYAGDQEKQLQRYYDNISEKDYKKIYILYLTLDGNQPSKQSLDLVPTQNVICMSYKKDIISWLDICIKETALFPTLRETILMYKNLVIKLTGETLERKIMMEIKELLKDKDNFRCATILNKALEEAMFDIQKDFWSRLEMNLKNKGYTISEKEDNYTKNSSYGISVDVDVSEQNKNMLKIQLDRGYIFYGFPDLKVNNDNITKCNGWIYWKWPQKKQIDFKETIITLVEEESREKVIVELADEVDEFIKEFKIKLKMPLIDEIAK